jgi:hypothetical protein
MLELGGEETVVCTRLGILTYAMVKPAKTPPARTRAMAMPKYSTRLPSRLGSSSCLRAWTRRAPKGSGRALTMGAKAWKRPRSSMLMRPLAPGRERAALMDEAMAISGT